MVEREIKSRSMAAKTWTIKEQNDLIANYYDKTEDQLEKMFKRKWSAIYSKAMQLGLYGKNKFKYIE